MEQRQNIVNDWLDQLNPSGVLSFCLVVINWGFMVDKSNFDRKIAAMQNCLDEWAAEQNKIHKQLHDERQRMQAMRRIHTKLKRIHIDSEYILNSVYVYSFTGLFK